jgi:tetratricopeptide (TPR) repeat protein
MIRPTPILAASLLLATLPGCTLNFDERVTGTAIGVGAGALAGGLLGTAVGNTATGAILGGVAGGAAGYIIGDWMADRRERDTMAARARDDEFRRAGPGAEETAAPAPAPVPFDAVPANATRPVSASASRAEMARRAYESGRTAKTAASALSHYESASRFDPSRPEPHNARGLVLLYEGRRPEARDAFQRALAVDPGYAPAAENLRKLGG